MEQYAYIRVSTKEQNVDRQLAAIESYDLPPKNIYCDYQSERILTDRHIRNCFEK